MSTGENHHQPVPSFVHGDLVELGLEVPSELLTRLARYLDMLLEANQRTNLTAIRDRDAAWRRLIIDSLTVLPGLDPVEEGGRVVDVGTGGGLPGLPVAICRPDLRVTLVDSTGKKVRFLQEVIDTLELSHATAIQERAETIGHNSDHREKYDVAVSRAIGPMTEVLEYSMPLLKVGGRVLAMKGPKAERELEDAGNALSLLGAGELVVFDAYPPVFENDLVIISVVKDRPTPKMYPRLPGVPRKEPL